MKFPPKRVFGGDFFVSVLDVFQDTCLDSGTNTATRRFVMATRSLKDAVELVVGDRKHVHIIFSAPAGKSPAEQLTKIVCGNNWPTDSVVGFDSKIQLSVCRGMYPMLNVVWGHIFERDFRSLEVPDNLPQIVADYKYEIWFNTKELHHLLMLNMAGFLKIRNPRIRCHEHGRDIVTDCIKGESLYMAYICIEPIAEGHMPKT